MAEGGAQDKQHAPTARRLAQARERGDVRRSADLPKAAAVVALSLGALAAAAGIGAHLMDECAAWLAVAGNAAPGVAAGWAAATAAAFAPLLGLIAAVGLAASLLSGGLVFSLPLLRPDFSKLMPNVGLGQLVSPQGLSETAKALVKFALIGGVGALGIMRRRADFAALAGLPVAAAGPALALALGLLSEICVALVALGAADMALQFWLHRQKLRMSDAEIREEMKDVAGNPQVRQRQRQLARRLARARQMRKIPEASVIVTNPTHYAVAIRYRRGADRAPMLLAKGVGLMAEEIVARGRGHGIPVVQAPPLARAVFRYVEPGEHVPVALYRACAEVLAYIWKMQRWRAQGGVRPNPPKLPADQEIEMSRRVG